MSTLSPIDTSGNLVPNSRSNSAQDANLGQEEYLKLMVTQFQNQDPFKPMENGDFLGQIAQFGTVSGISELKESFGAVAASISSEQTLQASGLIGRTVLAAVNTGELEEGGELAGAVDVPVSTSGVSVEVRDSAGQVVRHINLGPREDGLANFTWDGIDNNGESVPAGDYSFEAQIQTPTGQEAVGVLVAAEVESVSISPATGGLSLNFANLASLGLHQIRQIM